MFGFRSVNINNLTQSNQNSEDIKSALCYIIGIVKFVIQHSIILLHSLTEYLEIAHIISDVFKKCKHAKHFVFTNIVPSLF